MGELSVPAGSAVGVALSWSWFWFGPSSSRLAGGTPEGCRFAAELWAQVRGRCHWQTCQPGTEPSDSAWADLHPPAGTHHRHTSDTKHNRSEGPCVHMRGHLYWWRFSQNQNNQYTLFWFPKGTGEGSCVQVMGSQVQVRGYAYRWGVMCTGAGSCVQVRGHVYRWGVMCTGEGLCVQVRGHVYGWGVLCTGEGSCVHVRVHAYRWGVMCTHEGSCVQVRGPTWCSRLCERISSAWIFASSFMSSTS